MDWLDKLFSLLLSASKELARIAACALLAGLVLQLSPDWLISTLNLNHFRIEHGDVIGLAILLSASWLITLLVFTLWPKFGPIANNYKMRLAALAEKRQAESVQAKWIAQLKKQWITKLTQLTPDQRLILQDWKRPRADLDNPVIAGLVEVGFLEKVEYNGGFVFAEISKFWENPPLSEHELKALFNLTESTLSPQFRQKLKQP